MPERWNIVKKHTHQNLLTSITLIYNRTTYYSDYYVKSMWVVNVQKHKEVQYKSAKALLWSNYWPFTLPDSFKQAGIISSLFSLCFLEEKLEAEKKEVEREGIESEGVEFHCD